VHKLLKNVGATSNSRRQEGDTRKFHAEEPHILAQVSQQSGFVHPCVNICASHFTYRTWTR